ncbi:hypothetical protein QF001_004111 [Paraburkholderia youngii]|uniref:hypothetical protein n=1 Tax=Paraburkholderia youngii TaxID=2782701 RepID=UPI003D21D25E
MATYAIEGQSLEQVAHFLAGRFDRDVHIVEHESREGTLTGLMVNNPRGPDTPAIRLLFQQDAYVIQFGEELLQAAESAARPTR